MIQRAESVNPQILVWARERAGYTVEAVAEKLKKSPDEIAAWEVGSKAPTYLQLEKLAETLYKRPIALFFLPAPPDEKPIAEEFRTLPETELDSLEPDTRYALRDAKAFIASLYELSGGRNPADRLITRDISATVNDSAQHLAGIVREYIGINLDVQKSWASTREGMEKWRDATEGVGVFVFKRSFSQRAISGFCIHDSEFPVIIINNSTSFSRQIFTLFHELAHLLFDISGITIQAEDYYYEKDWTVGADIEVICNRFASAFLVPMSTFPFDQFNPNNLDAFVGGMAARYRVSKEVILRILLDQRLIDRSTYEQRAAQWNQGYEAGRAATGGNYYATQTAYLGRRFLDLAFSQYRAGNISVGQLADHLKVKASNIDKLETFLLTHG